MRPRHEHEGDLEEAPRRLRIPAALVVAFVGSAATVSAWYGGCDPTTPDPTPDGGPFIETYVDAATSDGDATTAPDDDLPPDPLPDASEPPH